MARLHAVSRVITVAVAIASAAAAAVSWAPAADAQVASQQRTDELVVRTLPVARGVDFELDGRRFATDATGEARIRTGSVANLEDRLRFVSPPVRDGEKWTLQRWFGLGNARNGPVTAGFRVDYRINLRFLDLSGEPIDHAGISSLTLKSTTGRVDELDTAELGRELWLPGTRVVPTPDGAEQKHITYAVQSAVMHGNTVVNRAQQRFNPEELTDWVVTLQLFAMHVRSRDAFFGRSVGRSVVITYPDGLEENRRLDHDASLSIPGLPRGDYQITVEGSGLRMPRPVSLSRNQDVEVELLTYLDIAAAAAALSIVVTLVLMIGAARRRMHKLHRQRSVAVAVAACLVSLLAMCTVGTRPALANEIVAVPPSPPVLAYYYLWFEPASWNRAKIDSPALGRYSSDDTAVMRKHVELAKRAGIGGFIVSWKSTSKNDRRLEKLAAVAREQDFKLVVIYQGLDFHRNPLTVEKVATDFDRFRDRFAASPVFRIWDRPTVIWSGTWKFSADDIKSVVEPRRERLQILATERNVDGFERLASFVDGNAYYWASVNPETFPGYDEKLAAFGRAVHARGGVWVAPVAPGFDARLVGGTSEVDRDDGATFRREWRSALQSAPDAIGLISWNEFSENTHIEPSVRHGARYLELLQELQGLPVDVRNDFDSSDTMRLDAGPKLGVAALVISLGLAVASVGTIARRRVRERRPTPKGRLA